MEGEQSAGEQAAAAEDWRDFLCRRLAAGEVLGQLCGRCGIPERAGVLAALRAEPAFARAFALALQLQRQQWAEEILEIADGSEPADPEGDGRMMLSHARLRMEARRWVQEMTRRAAVLPAEAGAEDGNEENSVEAGAERAEALLAAAQLDRAERAFLRRLLNKRLARKERRLQDNGPVR